MSNKKVLLLLCVVGVGIHSQIVLQDCPTDWLKYGDHCLKFVGYPRLQLNGATSFCRGLSSTLVSVNDLQEDAFITGWLEKNDGRRDTWLTSGIVLRNGIRWLGDGTESALNFWLPSYVSSPKLEGDSINYAFSGVAYGWGIADTGKNSSFICEIPVSEVYKIYGEPRDFDYGLDVEDPFLAPRGPKFIFEPVETTILSATTAAYLDCQASGLPEPDYTWLRGDGTNMNILQTGPGTRFSITGGRLTIDFPVKLDEGIYQCKASNQFGSILSKPVSLSFGTWAPGSREFSWPPAGQFPTHFWCWSHKHPLPRKRTYAHTEVMFPVGVTNSRHCCHPFTLNSESAFGEVSQPRRTQAVTQRSTRCNRENSLSQPVDLRV